MTHQQPLFYKVSIFKSMLMKAVDHPVINIPIGCITFIFCLNDRRAVGAKRKSITKRNYDENLWHNLTSLNISVLTEKRLVGYLICKTQKGSDKGINVTRMREAHYEFCCLTNENALTHLPWVPNITVSKLDQYCFGYLSSAQQPSH